MPVPEFLDQSRSAESVQRVRVPARSAVDMAEVLDRIWRQNLPTVRTRLASIEAAAQNALISNLGPAGRTEARDLAHKLAGSLGMFGHNTGTEAARKIEELLEGHEPVDAVQFARLAAQLRSALPL